MISYLNSEFQLSKTNGCCDIDEIEDKTTTTYQALEAALLPEWQRSLKKI